MAKRKEHAGETLEQLETAGDRLAEWIADNPILILGTALGILILAGGYGFASSARESSRNEASDALAALQAEFRVAMGAPLDGLELPEPANPETARTLRREYLERFRALATEHEGTVGAAIGWIEAGALEQALGNVDEAIAIWTAAADALSPDEITRSLLFTRVAAAHEQEGRWKEAAAAYQSAAAVDGYPLRYGALSEAARCYAEARDVDRAVAALATVEAEAPDDYVVPEHVKARVAELKAARSDS